MTPFTWDGLARGGRAATLLAVTSGIYGVAFGLVANQAGLALIEASLMSFFVFSGSAQLAAVALIAAGGAGLTSIALAICVMNARYILFGASLRPWLGQVSPLKAYGTLFFIVDGSWLISMKAYANGERDAAYILGASVAMLVCWIGGTMIGSLLGSALVTPHRLGIDFMLPGFAAAMMVGMTRTTMDLGPILVGALTAAAVGQVLPFGWAVVAAGLAGGAFAGYTHRTRVAT